MIQLTLFNKPRDVIVEVQNRLWLAYNDELRPWIRPEPIDMLPLALLSQRISHFEASTTINRLLTNYGNDWSKVASAPTYEIERRIQLTTRSEQKARRLQAALRNIQHLRGGRMDLDNLFELSTEDALQWLEQLYGVRRRVSSAVLLLSTTHRRTLPLDTGHRRLMMRLHILPYLIGWDEAHARIDELLPLEWSADEFELHHDLAKIHNETRCTAAEPRCSGCPLFDLCGVGKHFLSGAIPYDRKRNRQPSTRRRRRAYSQMSLAFEGVA